MRDSPRAEGKRWLEQAQTDLKWSRHLNTEGAYYLSLAETVVTQVEAWFSDTSP